MSIPPRITESALTVAAGKYMTSFFEVGGHFFAENTKG